LAERTIHTRPTGFVGTWRKIQWFLHVDTAQIEGGVAVVRGVFGNAGDLELARWRVPPDAPIGRSICRSHIRSNGFAVLMERVPPVIVY
jgi:hypothetical protein